VNGHSGPISGVSTGPDGLWATAGYDNRLLLWSGDRPVARAWHDHLVNQCAFDASGHWLVSASSDHTARLWRVPDLRLSAVLGDHEDDVEMAAFEPDGPRIATACRDHLVRTFNRQGAVLQRFVGHGADVISVAWARGGAELVSSSDDGTVRRWRAEDGRLLRTLDLGGETDTVVVAADGTLYAGNDAGEIVCIGPEAGAAAAVRVPAHRSGIKRLVLDASGQRLLSTSYDRSLAIWDLSGGRPVPTLRSEVPAVVWARSAAFGPEGRVLLGSFGAACAELCTHTGTWRVDHVADTGGLNAACVFAGSVWAVGDAGAVLREGAVVARLGSACNFIVPWGARLVAGGHLGAVFDVTASLVAGTPVVVHTHRSPLNCAAALPSGDLLVGAYTGEGLRFGLDARGVHLRGVVGLHGQAIKGLAAAEHGQVLSVSAAGEAGFHQSHQVLGELGRTESLNLCAEVQRWPEAHTRIANGACALPGGGFASVSRDRQLRIFDGDGGVRAVRSPHTHSIKCVSVSGDGRWIATGAYNGSVAFFDRHSETWAPMQRPTCAGISCLSAAAEPDALLASSYDGRIYRVRAHEASRVLPWARP
jgi:WD40 repeat protein